MVNMETEAKKHPVDDMSELQFFNALLDRFGPQRTTELLGWAVIGAILNWDNPVQLLEQLREKGMSKTGLYRALADFKRFGEEMENQVAPARDTTLAVKYMRKLGNLRLAVP